MESAKSGVFKPFLTDMSYSYPYETCFVCTTRNSLLIRENVKDRWRHAVTSSIREWRHNCKIVKNVKKWKFSKSLKIDILALLRWFYAIFRVIWPILGQNGQKIVQNGQKSVKMGRKSNFWKLSKNVKNRLINTF